MASATIAGDQHFGPVFFWREFEEPYGFMSQWYESPFEVDGVTYLTAEMWMMIEKARLFGDEEIAQQMMQTTIPGEHQALGRKAKGFDRKKWDDHKSRIVEEGNYHKFTKSKSNPDMLRMLLDTGDRELVESSPVDRIWGVGFGAANAEENRAEWGENRLGKAIMAVRDRLRQEGHR
ncbi:hypothetical protein BAUCODRAFT_114602 [Baudoinia panamericana UAMH 10762]|uniref:NADAR domain-containing protein n=1 Tax=Baudoinia panamericana (strain UAMH 10762) TaxID=717646 RepID=M2MMS2_BAUPA|nr:uncharacterized protein BAUCODRAFT_114602 [Baudoinia panamericana UAMH 10762]EMC92728.1 hypothetical protein BAUCODRAFT_114602 [Baudoinia panamericana UAMH 10762]